MKQAIQALVLLAMAISPIEAGFGRVFARCMRKPLALVASVFSLRTSFASNEKNVKESSASKESSDSDPLRQTIVLHVVRHDGFDGQMTQSHLNAFNDTKSSQRIQ